MTNSGLMWVWLAAMGLAGLGAGAYFGYGNHTRSGAVAIAVGWTAGFLFVSLGSAFVTQWVAIAPRRQRDEAQLQLSANARVFPDCEIEIKKMGYVDITTQDDLTDDPHRVILFEARVTNREDERRLNLKFELGVVWDPRPGEVKAFRSPFWAERFVAKRQYEKEVLPETLDVAPHTTTEGLLKYRTNDSDGFILFDGVGERDFSPDDKCRFEAEVTDYVSGESVAFVVPGTWSR